MRLEIARQDVDLTGTLRTQEFGVKAGAHLMMILSGLYKNPTDAMVREYITNMYDAYIALKTANPSAEILPAELQVPTALESVLVFKDYGIGMDIDTVWNVYTQYGNSTKNADNTQVGGFGLGSKVAFCYNAGSNWTVESRHNGMKHLFMAFINEERVPSLTHVSSTPTDEHSGVTVSVPILQKDAGAVREAVQRYAEFFPLPLKVSGMELAKSQPYVLRGKTWGIHAQPGYDNNARTVVVMGNVPYTLNVEDLRAMFTHSRMNVDYQFIANNSVNFFIPVGECEVVPSRDSLQLGDVTANGIMRSVEILKAELPDAINNAIATAPTQWAALQQLTNILSLRGIGDVVTVIGTWRGLSLSPDKGNITPLKSLKNRDASLTVAQLSIAGGRDSNIITTVLTDADDIVVRPITNRTWGQQVYCNFVILNDVGDTAKAERIARALISDRLWARSTSTSRRKLASGHRAGTVTVLNTSLTREKVQEICGGLPDELVLFASSLEKSLPAKVMKAVVKNPIYKLSPSRKNSWESRVKMPDDSETRYYLPLKLSGSGRAYFEEASVFVEIANAILGKHFAQAGTDILYGIKETDLDRVKNNPKWINAYDAVEKIVLKWIDGHENIVRAARMCSGQYTNSIVQLVARIQSAGEGYAARIPADLMEYYKLARLRFSAQTDATLRRVDRFGGMNETVEARLCAVSTDTEADVSNVEAALLKKYPMFGITLKFNAYALNSLGVELYGVVLDYFESLN